MKNKIYYVINIIFLVTSILFVNYTGILEMKFTIWQLSILALIFLIIHTFKFFKIYFILLEEKIPLKTMIKLYIKTAFVSTVLPYKIGELFKMYTYGNEIKNYTKGIIAVTIDKFFDSLILCLILVPYSLIMTGKVSEMGLIMFVFFIVTLMIYMCFENTYYYLNKFFVLKNQTQKSVLALKALEKVHGVYIKTKEMLRGRYLILLISTAVAWGFESIFIYVIAGFMNIKVEFMTVTNYISDAFFGINNILFNNYIYICTAIFLIMTLVIYFNKYVWKKRIQKQL